MATGLELCRVVLVEPHYPGNIGATARIMANMGLRDLVLVNPIADLADPQARQMATHGAAILDGARCVTDLAHALADCVLVIATSAATGSLMRRQNVGPPDEVLPRVADVLRQGQPAALVFGPEPTGLSNDAITRSHHVIRIPTAADAPSLNLAQAVAICLYELRRAWEQTSSPVESRALADFATQERMFASLQTALEEIHFLYGPKADSLMHAMRHLLGRADLTDTEAHILLGLARQIRWYVAQHPPKSDEK